MRKSEKLHKNKTSGLFWCILFSPQKNNIKRGECLMENSIYHSKTVYNCLKQLNLCRIFPHTVIKHILAVLIAVFSHDYKGKTVNFQDYSPCHRTTIAHFLNKGNWDSTGLEDILKDSVARFIYRQAFITGKPVFLYCGMIPLPLKQKPSSWALQSELMTRIFNQSPF